MTPKEKASHLFYTIDKELYFDDKASPKELAVLFVDEILKPENHFITTKGQLDFWQEVKEEINKL